MIFGFSVEPIYILIGGVTAFLLIGFQVLVGMRKIHFKGRRHQKVHKWAAWVLVGFAAVHGFMGFVYALGLTIG